MRTRPILYTPTPTEAIKTIVDYAATLEIQVASLVRQRDYWQQAYAKESERRVRAVIERMPADDPMRTWLETPLDHAPTAAPGQEEHHAG